MGEVEGVVLAGGRGSRMGRLGETYAKALLPVGNQPLVAHHLRLLASLGVRRVLVVIGHRADDVAAVVGDGSAFGLTVRFVEQGPPLGSAHALARVRPMVDGPVLVVLGDYYFVPRAPERMLQRLRDGTTAIACLRESNATLLRAACAIEADDDARVTSIVEKPFRPRTDVKGCGFYALQPEFFDALARTPRTALRDEYELTVALELHVAAGFPVFAEPVVARDSNLTVPDDVLACNLAWLADQGCTSLIAPDALVESEVALDSTLVGGGASVEGVRRLREVVVFPGAHLSGSGEVARTLVTTAGSFVCLPTDIA